MVRGVVDTLARAANAQPTYWLEDDAGDWIDSADYCKGCATKAKVGRGDIHVCGPMQFEESDSCRHCENCGALLNYRLTEYGVREEVEYFLTHGVRYPLTPIEAYHLQAVEDALEAYGLDWRTIDAPLATKS